YGNFVVNGVLGDESYAFFNLTDFSNLVKWCLYGESRPTHALYAKVIDILNFNPTHTLSLTFAIVLIGFSINCAMSYILISNRIKPFVKNNSIISFVLILSIAAVYFNPFLTYGFQVPEAAVMTPIITALSILAAYFISKNIGFNFKDFIISSLLVTVSMFGYQAIPFYFVFFSMFFYFFDYTVSLSLKQRYPLVIELLKRVSVYAVAVSSQILYMAFVIKFNSYRGNLPAINYRSNILSSVYFQLNDLWISVYNFYPKYLFLVLVFLLVCTLIFIIFFDRSIEKKWSKLLIAFLTFLGTYITIFVPTVLENWYQPSMLFGFPALLPLLAIIILPFAINGRMHKYTVGICVFCLLVLNIFNYKAILRMHSALFITNTMERYISEYYINIVKEFEKNNATVISKEAYCADEKYTAKFVKDKYAPYRFAARYYERLLKTFPDPNFIFKMQGLDKLERVQMPDEIFQKYFAGRNWDTLSPEQVVFENDTVYICLY
ncbi:MAG: hypothetical protein LBE13_02170, partial [Bacteroidales bacterium]|nr:hypothetical protein [Bacteroidales bacterium]